MDFRKLLGGRVLKTGLSVFITAYICQSLNFPVIFAVIAAIVTIEPTVAASIKKGKIRLPAAAIGAAFAMLFDFWFGPVPLAFALAAVCTIIVCHRLHWDEAIIVATLTAVAMIPETEDHFLLSFIVRLVTTSIGIIVSTVVNLLVMPPHFDRMIDRLEKELAERVAALLRDCVRYVCCREKRPQNFRSRFSRLSKDLERTFQLIQYQREEWGYRKHSMADIRTFTIQQKEIALLEKLIHHLGNLITMEPVEKTAAKAQRLEGMTETIVAHICSKTMEEDGLEAVSADLRQWVMEEEAREQQKNQLYFSSQLLFYYEMLEICHVISERKKFRRYFSERQDVEKEKSGADQT